ncbi:uncharacterized protein [Scyliorhinus torazame]|uniref:uncharacterized protein isoform X4 n=1 Tax=Scyliorhinus torazame TaxID=75743 RepID=UPI003B5C4600
MAATASNPSAVKIANTKRVLTNQSEIKSKVKVASNAKVSRNSKQKRNSLPEVQESSRGRWWQENIKGTLTATSHNLKTPLFGKSTAKLGKVDFLSPFSQGNFRSSVKRFPTIYFVPKEGPAPGQYNVKHETFSQMITSSFQSKVPRFLTHPNKTPGPGAYDPIRRTRAASSLYYYQLNT